MGLTRPSQVLDRPDTGVSKELQQANLTSQINGSTQNFTVPKKYKTGSLRVYWNGLRQVQDVTFTEISTTVFQTTFTPEVGDYIVIDYYAK